ncbi:MAG: hypothetical protein N3C59_10225, partial [Azovibrio sp.]|nr:hypothetical protein [Azovibrio sp.]
QLLAEIAKLQQQRDALRAGDLERLVSYLPALYKHFFATVAPADLALLCGRVEPPVIPNPWPEPAPETLRRLQADFRALPPDVQAQIIQMAKGLPQAKQLVRRAEMSDCLESW